MEKFIYSKTFYYRMAVTVDSHEPLEDVTDATLLPEVCAKFDYDPGTSIRITGIDLLKKSSFEKEVERLSLIVDRMEKMPQSTNDILDKIEFWTNSMIQMYGAIDVLGYLKQYIEKLKSGDT